MAEITEQDTGYPGFTKERREAAGTSGARKKFDDTVAAVSVGIDEGTKNFLVALINELLGGGYRTQHEKAAIQAKANIATIENALDKNIAQQRADERDVRTTITSRAAFSGVLQTGSVQGQKQQAADVLAANIQTLNEGADYAKDPYLDAGDDNWFDTFWKGMLDMGAREGTALLGTVTTEALDVLFEDTTVDLTPTGATIVEDHVPTDELITGSMGLLSGYPSVSPDYDLLQRSGRRRRGGYPQDSPLSLRDVDF